MKSKAYQQVINELFTYLHKNPEKSWEEWGTTAYLQEFLAAHGIQSKAFENIPGFTAVIGSGKPVVALRADMDALVQNVDGTVKPNHACGHDAHMTIVSTAALMLKNSLKTGEGTVKLIFQPAEEKGTGALAVVEEGAVDDVDYLFGIHLRPEQELPLGKAAVSIDHGAAVFMHGEIHGRDVHGARPHLGSNAIETASEILQQLQHIHLDPLVPHSVKMTQLHAGGDSLNIIPGSASFSLDLRTQTNEAMDTVTERIDGIIRRTSDYHAVPIEIKEAARIAAAEISSRAEHITRAAIEEVLGKNNAVPSLTTSGGDDFHFYTIKRPHLHACMIGLGAGLTPGLHDAEMTFHKEALTIGAELVYYTSMKALNF
ncbi:amidohydrolase [Alkalicoccus halolimnae]|uniref:Amidohydrolase n=1 Tax=Alkalicoccus halolimnae TaxID=1667239 RepID=A0A5C7F5X5_9BACI|nr:amidohydrolase [Alkalicoccus halolimnae]TXF84661.1 amidohydrolase [Alkalicoccus halolimnae]